MKRFSQFIMKHYRLVLVCGAVLMAVSLFFASRLKAQTAIADMLPEDSEFVLAQQEFSEYFDSEDSVLVIMQGDGELCRQYADELAKAITNKGIASGILYKVEYSEIWQWLPLYADIELYNRLESGDITPEQFSNMLQGSGSKEAEYLVSDDGTTYMMVIKPKMDGEDYVAVRDNFFTGLSAAMDEAAVPGVDAGYTGGTFVQDYQADSVMFESLSATTLIALGLIILLIIGSFGRVLLPGLSGLPLVLGVAMAAAFATFTYGSINTFTISFAALLLGLGIDFAIHILNKYFEERYNGAGTEESLTKALSETGLSIIIGAATTAFAFLAFLFAKFKAFGEMAVVSSAGIVMLCAVMMFLVPAIIMLVDSRSKKNKPLFFVKYAFLENIGRFSKKRAVYVIIVSFVLIVALLFPMRKTSISTSLDDIYPSDLPSSPWLSVVEDKFDYNPNTLSVMMDNVEELEEAIDGLQDFDGIKAVSSALDYLPVGQQYKLEVLAKLGMEIAPMTVDNLPEAVKSNFVGRDGRLLIEIVPEGGMDGAVAYEELKENIKKATGRVPVGMPGIMNEVTAYVKSDVLLISLLCLGMIFVLLLIAYRSVKTAIITTIPVIFSVLATLGIMEILGFTTTIFSLIGLPLVIGIGIDSGVHMMHRMLNEDDVATAVAGTGRAVIMTTLTTLIGFGSIAFSNHKGLAGLGMTVAVGMALCMAITLVLLPALKTVFIKSKPGEETKAA